jgi:hypothetical protein
MKITKKYLRDIIEEEVQGLTSESPRTSSSGLKPESWHQDVAHCAALRAANIDAVNHGEEAGPSACRIDDNVLEPSALFYSHRRRGQGERLTFGQYVSQRMAEEIKLTPIRTQARASMSIEGEEWDRDVELCASTGECRLDDDVADPNTGTVTFAAAVAAKKKEIKETMRPGGVMRTTKKYLQKVIEEEAKAALEEGTTESDTSWICDRVGDSLDSNAVKACEVISTIVSNNHRQLPFLLHELGSIEAALDGGQGLEEAWTKAGEKREADARNLQAMSKEFDAQWAEVFSKIRKLKERINRK